MTHSSMTGKSGSCPCEVCSNICTIDSTSQMMVTYSRIVAPHSARVRPPTSSVYTSKVQVYRGHDATRRASEQGCACFMESLMTSSSGRRWVVVRCCPTGSGRQLNLGSPSSARFTCAPRHCQLHTLGTHLPIDSSNQDAIVTVSWQTAQTSHPNYKTQLEQGKTMSDVPKELRSWQGHTTQVGKSAYKRARCGS